MTGRRFTYRAVGANGAPIEASIQAETRSQALRSLSRSGVTPVGLEEEAGPSKAQIGRRPPQALALIALKQLAVMTRAAVDLLDAIEIVAASVPNRALGEALRNTAALLRQGDRLGNALRRAAPYYPPYVYALISAGEASGRLPLVLEEAARQLQFEQRLARDIVNALTYPGFLVASGAASVAFLFYAVVPRFAGMLRNSTTEMSPLSAFVLNAGVAFHDHVGLYLTALALAALALAASAQSPQAKAAFSTLLHALPGVRHLLLTRHRTTWSRIMAIGLGAGVEVTDAAALAADAIPAGKLKRDVLASIPELRAGKPVDSVFLASNVLSPVDASLVRAGQHSGAMAEMFRAAADRNEEDMRDALKRLTLILEPAAIALVAAMIGAIVLGLVSALAGIYESIG